MTNQPISQLLWSIKRWEEEKEEEKNGRGRLSQFCAIDSKIMLMIMMMTSSISFHQEEEEEEEVEVKVERLKRWRDKGGGVEEGWKDRSGVIHAKINNVVVLRIHISHGIYLWIVLSKVYKW